MNRQNVVSSNIRSIGYDQISMVLEVEFLNGSVYQYIGVPESLFNELMKAPSHGTFLAQNIKDRFAYRRIS